MSYLDVGRRTLEDVDLLFGDVAGDYRGVVGGVERGVVESALVGIADERETESLRSLGLPEALTLGDTEYGVGVFRSGGESLLVEGDLPECVGGRNAY